MSDIIATELMDNADGNELTRQLLIEQRRTNQLLALAERRAQRAEQLAQRECIAKRHGVDVSEVVLGDDQIYSIVRKRIEAWKERANQP